MVTHSASIGLLQGVIGEIFTLATHWSRSVYIRVGVITDNLGGPTLTEISVSKQQKHMIWCLVKSI